MSLRIWLPFNDSLQDKISNIQATTTGTITYEDGKITPKSLRVAGAGRVKIPYKHIKTNQLSIAFWLKTFEAAANWSDVFSLGARPTNQSLPEGEAKDRYIPRMEIGATQQDGSRYFYWYGNLARSGARLFEVNYDKWEHFAIVADGNCVKFFKNGKQERIVIFDQWANESPQDSTVEQAFQPYEDLKYDIDYISIASRYLSGGTQIYNGCINDFRVYDHALSPIEVYELSLGLLAHYQLKGKGRTNLLLGANQYTSATPLTRTASVNGSNSLSDSYVYHTDIMFTVPKTGDYTFVLNSNGTPCGHDRTINQSASKGFCLVLRQTGTNTHPIWEDYGTASDGRVYGVFKNLKAGATYDLRTNLYAGPDSNQTDYSVNFWDMKILQGGFDDCEIFTSTTKEPNAAGYSTAATVVGSVTIYGDAPRNERSYKFNEGSYLSCGSGAKVKDQITVSCWGYLDDWSEVTGTRLISCTEGGGWNFRCGSTEKIEAATNPIAFVIGTGTESNSYLSAEATDMPWNSLAAGWHFFVGTYDGKKAKIYIDGQYKGESVELNQKTPIYYNSSNSLLIGMEAGATAGAAEENGISFKGLLSDARIYGTALSATDILDLFRDAAYIDKNGKLFSRGFALNEEQQIERNGVIKYSSLDEIDAPAYEAKQKRLPDGSTWARIHHLDATVDKEYFANATEVEKCLNKSNRYSRLYALEKYKKNNEYEFMLTYPKLRRSVPSGFLELQYIEATGEQYINTGVSGGARWEFDIEFTDNCLPLIPPLTSNSQLSSYWGTAKVFSSLGETHVENAYRAFDQDRSSQADVWYGQLYQPGTIVGFEFLSAKPNIKKIRLNGHMDTSSTISSGTIECKVNDEWVAVVTLNSSNFQNDKLNFYEVELPEIQGIRASATSTTGSGLIIRDLNVYGAKRQLMGYGGSAGEYWGKQVDDTYGLFVGETTVKAVQRDSVVHNLENKGSNYLWMRDHKRDLADQTSQANNGQYWIFDLSSGNRVYACGAKLYACRCVQDGVIKEYVPAKRLSDGAIGLCDVFTGNFYSSSTNVPLVGGPIKTKFLQYVQTNGQQTINTGLSPSDLADEKELRVELRVSYDRIVTDPSQNGYNQIMGFNGHAGMGIGIQGNTFWECPDSTAEANRVYNLTWIQKGGEYKRIINGQEYSGNHNSFSHSVTNLTLFSASLDANDPLPAYHCFCKLYAAKIYIDDIMVRDFRPYIKANGEVVLLDMIEGGFYTAGTKTLSGGPALDSIPLYNRWIQTSNPRHASVQGEFRPIHTSWTQHFGPLKKTSGRAEYCCENLDSGGWYGALGQTLPWDLPGDIPAADGSSQTETELWVRINKESTLNSDVEFYEDRLVINEYVEI